MKMANESDSNRFVQSVDTLFGGPIQPQPCVWFGDGAPLILGAKNDKDSLKSVSDLQISLCILLLHDSDLLI
jgi:hypothetical protein